MKKKEISREINKLDFPRIPPYKNVGDYLTSRENMAKVALRAYEWDKPRHDPALHLTATRRIFNATEETLAEKREFYKMERKKLDEQWKELKRKQTELKESFERMDDFIKTNADKRERAKQRCKEDVKMRLERTKEIERLQTTIISMQEVKAEFDKEIAMHKFYEKYLNLVVDESTEFKNIDAVIDRYESLIKTKRELGERQSLCLAELEEARAKTAKLSDEYLLLILGLNNVVGNLNARYCIAVRNAMHWESQVCAIKNRAFQKYQEINEVRQACWNIYMLMCKRKGEPLKIPEDDFEMQLSYIKKTLRELKIVGQEAQTVLKKTYSSIKGQVSKVS